MESKPYYDDVDDSVSDETRAYIVQTGAVRLVRGSDESGQWYTVPQRERWVSGPCGWTQSWQTDFARKRYDEPVRT